MRRFAPLIKEANFFDWGRFTCYLLILADIPPIKIFLFLSCVNIILTRIKSLRIPGRLWTIFTAKTFHRLMSSCVTATPSSVRLRVFLPACCVPFLSLWNLKSFLIPIGLCSLNLTLFMPS